MKVSVEELDEGRKQLTIKASWDEIASDYELAADNYKKKGISGFRPGKAPRAIVEARYAAQIRDEIKARCPRRLMQQAVLDQGLGWAAACKYEDMQYEKKKSLSFKVAVETAPDFELPDYHKIPLPDDMDPAKEEEALREYMKDWLVLNTSMELPASLIDQEIADAAENRDADNAGKTTRQAAEDRVKLMLIVNRIAEKEGWIVEDSDIDQHIVEMAEGLKTKPEKVRRELVGRNGLIRIKHFLVAERVLDKLLEKYTV